MKIFGINIGRRSTDDWDKANTEEYWAGELGRMISDAGVNVTPETAVKSSAVYSCVARYCDTFASLPLIIYEKTKGGGRIRAESHRLYQLLNLAPNPSMSRADFWTMAGWHVMLRGNFYAYINMDKRGNIISLIPMSPDLVTVRVDKDTNTLVYTYRNEKFLPGEILHLRGITRDGILGEGPIQLAMEPIGNSIALSTYESKVFSNSARMSGVLEHPSALSPKARDNIIKGFREAYSGVENSGKVALLEEGMKFNKIAMSNQDAEFIQTKVSSRSEVCGLFGIPPYMIGEMGRATWSNVENLFIQYVVQGAMPHLIRFEQTLMRSLFDKSELDKYYIKFSIDGLLRGDMKSRFEAYEKGIQNGILTWNEAREAEERNPFDWGNATMIPGNMRPVTQEADLFRPLSGKNQPVSDVIAPSNEKKSGNSHKDAIEKLCSRFLDRLHTKEANTVQRDVYQEIEKVQQFYLEKLTGIVYTELNSVVDVCTDIVGEREGKDIFVQNFVKNYISRQFERVKSGDRLTNPDTNGLYSGLYRSELLKFFDF